MSNEELEIDKCLKKYIIAKEIGNNEKIFKLVNARETFDYLILTYKLKTDYKKK